MRVQKGYYIRAKRDGDGLGNLTSAWGFDDALPEEWQEVQQDPTVQQAEIFRSTQRRVRADKRKLLDTYSRGEAADQAS